MVLAQSVKTTSIILNHHDKCEIFGKISSNNNIDKSQPGCLHDKAKILKRR